MIEFSFLPAEILHRICFRADLAGRKALCLTNRHLANIAQPWVFQTTAVSPLKASCDRLQNILKNTRLAGYVNKLYIITYNLDKDGDYMHYSDAEGEEDELEEQTGLPLRFWNLFDRLKDLPRLQSIALCFHPEHTNYEWHPVPQEMSFRSPVVQRAFAAFAAQPQPLKELALAELHNINETDLRAVSNIRRVLSALQSLRLNITNEHREFHGELDYQRTEAHEFYQTLPSFWLEPTTANLRHLTIYSSLYCGFYPKLDFRALHFPHLKTLSLGNYGFVHDSQLAWILAHADTLEELYLDDCGILYEVSIKDFGNTYLPPDQYTQRDGLHDALYACYTKRWADYFRAFKDGLPHLRRFRYGHSPEGWEYNSTPFEREAEIEIGLHEESYLVFCDGFGPSPYMKELIYRYPRNADGDGGGQGYVHAQTLTPFDEDKMALEELCRKLGQSVPSREE
ncbi:hypothetical protein BDW60DRAFT_155520 [Aspergillus nidulans var. acristatus]